MIARRHVSSGLLHHVSGLVCQELATACAGQRSVSGKVHNATVSECFGIELASPAISCWALTHFDGCGRRTHLLLNAGANIAGQVDS